MTPEPAKAIENRGRRILPRQSVTVLREPVRVGNMKLNNEGIDVELVRDGNTIKEIHVRCPCGQTIVLTCEYASVAGSE